MSRKPEFGTSMHAVGQAITLAGFAIELITKILQAHGIFHISSNRQTLLVGAIVAGLAGLFFLLSGLSKYFRYKRPEQYHHPRWDLLVAVALITLAYFCWAARPASSPHSRPASAALAGNLAYGQLTAAIGQVTPAYGSDLFGHAGPGASPSSCQEVRQHAVCRLSPGLPGQCHGSRQANVIDIRRTYSNDRVVHV